MFAIVRKGDNHRLPPALDDDGTDSFLVWPTREQAEQGLRFQWETYLDPEDGEEWEIVPVSELKPVVRQAE